MKRDMLCTFCVIALLMLLPALSAAAADEQPAIYEAYANTEFHVRKAPEDRAYRIREVERGDALLVLQYGPEWCTVSYDGATGYCKARWLYRFRSLRPFDAPIPQAPFQAGIAKVTAPYHVSAAKYGGNDLRVGDLLSVAQWAEGGGVVNMMRETASIPADVLAFTPFVPWKDAKEGELIGGFTTYYNEKTGGKLSKNRQWNIELACQRVSGFVVAPGDYFSYNELCSPYKKSNGYKEAPNISNEGVGYGGGVCQLTTTIYNAALTLPLQIEEWVLHRDSGVPYIPRGFDAAVGSYSDFTFENTLPYDIRLEALPQNGVLTVLIHRN
jgi:hypothetical protein